MSKKCGYKNTVQKKMLRETNNYSFYSESYSSSALLPFRTLKLTVNLKIFFLHYKGVYKLI